jgi:hypothetical protein
MGQPCPLGRSPQKQPDREIRRSRHPMIFQYIVFMFHDPFIQISGGLPFNMPVVGGSSPMGDGNEKRYQSAGAWRHTAQCPFF